MWDFSKISLGISANIREAINVTSVCKNRHLPDKRVWDSVGGDFKLGKAYSLACNNRPECSSFKPSSWIWKVRTRPRIMFFLWQCYHLNVPVWETLASRGIDIPTFCPRCLDLNESLIHMLRIALILLLFGAPFDFQH